MHINMAKLKNYILIHASLQKKCFDYGTQIGTILKVLKTLNWKIVENIFQ